VRVAALRRDGGEVTVDLTIAVKPTGEDGGVLITGSLRAVGAPVTIVT
jgi:hypothetical protein